jgi:hypothetical protein
MSKDIYPEARKDRLVTSKVGDETVVYDTEKNFASCLNELTTAVWEACDGNTDVSSILDIVRNAGYQDTTEQVILIALDQLSQANLLDETFNIDHRITKNLSRRKTLHLLAKSAAILPIVSTIVVSPPLAAQSENRPNGSSCTDSSQCASGCCHRGDHCSNGPPCS